jgi:nicotinic acid mononucleotide adenylyltransferase
MDRATRTGQASYTIDTLLDLKKEHSQLAFVAGADQLPQLQNWHRFRELLVCCHWIILTRKPDGEGTAMKVLKEWELSGLIRKENDEWSTSATTRLRVVPTDARAMASSLIRESIARESDPESLLKELQPQLLPSVLRYLMEHRIYGMRPHEHER